MVGPQYKYIFRKSVADEEEQDRIKKSFEIEFEGDVILLGPPKGNLPKVLLYNF